MFKRLFVSSVLTLIIFISVSRADSKPLCQVMFGQNAQLTYEPIESNGGVIVTHSLTGKSEKKRKVGVPNPSGFRCGMFDIDSKIKECPKGMSFNKKRLGRKICLSREFPINELCDKGLEKEWPDVAVKICKKD